MSATVTTSRCRSCDAEVVFVPSAKSGKPMILDAKPEKRVLIVHPEDDLILATELDFISGDTTAKVWDTYTDHHVTCPDAAAWKGKHR